MDQRDKSREEWEREFKEVQHSVTPGQWLRADQITAQKLSALPAPIPDFPHLLRGLLGLALLAFAFLIPLFEVPHKVWLCAALLIAGCCIGLTAFRWRRGRD